MNVNINIEYKTLIIAVLWLFASCSLDDAMTIVQNHDTELKFTLTSNATPIVTRTEGADAYANGLPEGSTVGVFLYDSDGYDLSVEQIGTPTTWTYKTEKVTSDGLTVLDLSIPGYKKNPRYPVNLDSSDKDYIEVFAVYPNNPSVTPATTIYTFEAKLDQTTAASVAASDFMATDVAHYDATYCNANNIQLLMKHRMARLKVAFVPKTGSDLTSANMPTTFDVLNVEHTLSIMPKIGLVTSSGNATTEENPIKGSVSESFLIAPQTIAEGTKLLKFDILPYNYENGTLFKGIKGLTFSLPSNIEFKAGYRYDIKVVIDIDHVTTTGSINAWTEQNISFDPRIL